MPSISPDSPMRPELARRALAWADARLRTTPHTKISVRAVATRHDVTPPALIKHFGSTTGFLAALASLQWDRLAVDLNKVMRDPKAIALQYVMWSFDNPHRFRLLYEPSLWASNSERTKTGKRSTRSDQTAAETRQMMAAKLECYALYVAAEESAGEESALRVKLLTSLATGLALEFVNERLFPAEENEVKRRQMCKGLAQKVIKEAMERSK